MKCEKCGNEFDAGSKFCANCGYKCSSSPSGEGGAINSHKEWFQKNWVWLWLILFWPVGVYGLIQRAEPERRKWWWFGIVALFLVAGVSNRHNGASDSFSDGNGIAYVNSNQIICGTKDQFDEQNKWLAQGVKRLSSGCYITNSPINVVVLKWGLTMKVRDLESGQAFWAATESVVVE